MKRPSQNDVASRTGRAGRRAFTLVELLVVMAILALLAALLLPALGKSRSRALGSVCVGNLRQLGAAVAMYALDHQGLIPVSTFGHRWTTTLQTVYRDTRVLQCPLDTSIRSAPVPTNPPADSAPRSFVFNGFSDFLAGKYPGKLVVPLRQGLVAEGMPESLIEEPNETLWFGEKASSSLAWELDLLIPNAGFLADLEESRHGVRGSTRRGSANYAFADGSVRSLPFGESTCPVNLWGVTDSSRRDAAICRPR
jgi:prepilin-type N-terminal cleavage/methylation domain-containing protein/prepilin-type processing-associated H-X9-DG protein